jgi:hypothetical protein
MSRVKHIKLLAIKNRLQLLLFDHNIYKYHANINTLNEMLVSAL